MDFEKRWSLVTRNTVEIIGGDDLKALLNSKKNISVYIGTAITGRPHIAYFAWILKLSDFIRAGLNVKLLLADIHGALDNTPWSVLNERYKYYEEAIYQMFGAVGTNVKDFEIVKGSSFELNKDYIFDLLKLSTFVSLRDARKAASDVVKNIEGDQARLSGLLYPLMQALDEQYLGVDIQYGGVDQRKLFVFARESLPKIGYKPRIEIMSSLIPALNKTGKMSASDVKSKIDLLDDEKTVVEKINSAYCMEGDPNNGLMAFLRHVIMIFKTDKNEKFFIERHEKFGGNREYNNYDDLEKDFIAKKLHPLDLKVALSREINNILKRINKKKLAKLSKEAYEG